MNDVFYSILFSHIRITNTHFLNAAIKQYNEYLKLSIYVFFLSRVRIVLLPRGLKYYCPDDTINVLIYCHTCTFYECITINLLFTKKNEVQIEWQ